MRTVLLGNSRFGKEAQGGGLEETCFRIEGGKSGGDGWGGVCRVMWG